MPSRTAQPTTPPSAQKLRQGKSGESLFFDLALEDLTAAADLFRPIHDRTNGVDGWVSLEVSPLLAHDTETHTRRGQGAARARRPPQPLHQDPGHREGLPAIEEAIFAGVPVNVTLLFSREQYVAAAEAYLRGIERRIAAGLNPKVGSVASLFVSRWDVAVAGKVPAGAGQPARHRHRQAHLQGVPRAACSPRWQRVFNAGARPQRLLWASTGTKDPKASDILYVKALAAPFTVNTMPEATLKALPITARSARPCRPTAATAKPCWPVCGRGHRYRCAGREAPVRGRRPSRSWNELMDVLSSRVRRSAMLRSERTTGVGQSSPCRGSAGFPWERPWSRRAPGQDR